LEGTAVLFQLKEKSYIFEFDPVQNKFLSGADLGENWLGVSSATHFTMAGQLFVLVANYWDGFNRNVSSKLLRFDKMIKQFNLVQSIPTHGARRWRHFEFKGAHYFVVANHVGPSTIYGWDNSTMQLNTSASVRIASNHTSSVVVFQSQGTTFMAMSSDDEDAVSSAKVFVIETDPTYGVRADLFQTLQECVRSLDVTHSQLSGVAHLVFAVNTSNFSPVYALSPSGEQFVMVQKLPVSNVTSVFLFDSPSTTAEGSPISAQYLLVKQRDANVLMFRWNGASFLGVTSAATRPEDAAGGQVLRFSEGSGAITHFRVPSPGGNPVDYVIVGNRQDSMLYRGQHDSLDALSGPSTLAVTEKYVFVGCQTSKAIVVLRRDPISGRILWQSEATYLTNFTKSLLKNSGVACLGGCQCNPSNATNGTISDGPLNYTDMMNCQWLITAEYGKAISLSFTSFNTEKDHDFVTIYRCSTSSCNSDSREEVARLSGINVNSTIYTSSTGYLQVVFMSDGSTHYPGFLAEWKVTSIIDFDIDVWNMGFPIQGISSMAVSPSGDKLFTTGYVDNTVAAFHINQTDGTLTLLTWIQEGTMDSGGRRVDGLEGAFGISVTTTNDVYVAGSVDQAITVLQYQSDEGFILIDRLKNGERLISAFKGIRAEDLTDNMNVNNGPVRLRDGTADQIWEFSARDSQHISIGGETYLIVASSDEGWCPAIDKSCIPANGTASLYRWDSTKLSFELHQILKSEIEASAVVAFHTQERGGTQGSYVAIANMFGKRQMSPAPQGTINVYKWDESVKRLVHNHTIRSPKTAGNECPREMSHIEIAGIHYLAVANTWNEPECRGPSHVYRWDTKASRGAGFGFLESMDTRSATDIRFGRLGDTIVLVVSNENMIEKHVYEGGGVEVYEFKAEAQSFTKLQTIPASRVLGIDLFRLPGVGDILAIAAHQTRSPSSENDYLAYDAPSALYVWRQDTFNFELYQTFSNIGTVIEDEANAEKKSSFCDVNCYTSADGATNILPYLRGVASFTAFESDGEYYLAVAQSVCESFVDRLSCISDWGQPKSAILQFDKDKKMFGEMLAITDADNNRLRSTDVSPLELRMHSQALRINGGRALKWEYVDAGNGFEMLILCSATQGAIVYPWKFETVQGLGGVVDVLENPRRDNLGSSGRKVYAISRLESAFVKMNRKTVRDALGSAPKTACYNDKMNCDPLCSNLTIPCLEFKSVVYTKMAQVSGLTGLGNVYKMFVGQGSRALHQFNAEELCRDRDCAFIAVGGLHRDELVCGDFSVTVKNSYARAPQCQPLSFNLTMTATDDIQLFQGPDAIAPVLSPEGVLHFKSAPHRTGSATFSVVLAENETPEVFAQSGEHSRKSSSSKFILHIAPINSPPSFTSHDIHVRERKTSKGFETFLFATDVSPGENEKKQKLKWIFTYTGDVIFSDHPQLYFQEENGSLLGYVNISILALTYGSSQLKVILVDDVLSTRRPPLCSSCSGHGVCDAAGYCLCVSDYLGADCSIDVSKPQSRESLIAALVSASEEHTVSIKIEPVNNEPTAILQRSLSLVQNAKAQIIQDFVKEVNLGSKNEAEQNYTFSLLRVETVKGVWSGADLFESFLLTKNGTLQFKTAPTHSGEFDVSVKIEDDGGYLNGGQNFSVSRFRVSILADRPVFSNAAQIQVPNDGVLTVRPAFFQFEGPTDSFQERTFRIVNSSNPSIFSQLPTVYANGTIIFKILEFSLGSSRLDVKLAVNGLGANYSRPESDVQSVEIVINPIKLAPRFSLPKMITAPEDGGPLTRHLAFNIQAGHPKEKLLDVYFKVTYDSQHLFAMPPTVSPDGRVNFTGAAGQHGVSKLTIELFAVQPGHPSSGPQTCLLKIFPLPRILSILPAFGPMDGGSEVTIKGMYFGSAYSRGHSAATYGGFKVHVGNQRCIAEKFISDSEVLCLIPRGAGLSTVTISITDVPDAVRTGSLNESFSFVEVYYGGILPDSVARGFLAMGPTLTSVPSDIDATYRVVDLDIFGSVLSVVSFGGVPCVAGTFQKVGETRLGYLFCWDGHSPKPVGSGVDGSVLAMASYAGMLVVGGTFNKAYQSEGYGFVQTGNLAVWNGSAWSVLGEAKFDGAVSAIAVHGSLIYIAGRFRRVGLLQVDGLARYDGKRWSDVGGGVGGGSINSMWVDHEFLFIGGSFRTAGNLSVNGLARWDSRQWQALGRFNGEVHGVAVLGPDLFVAGEFTEVDGMHVDYIVRYVSGAWQKLDGGGVNGGVSSVTVSNNCLYFSGRFTALRNSAGEEFELAQHAGRYCPQPRTPGRLMEGVLTKSTTGPIRSVTASSDLDVATREARARSWQQAFLQGHG
jgi:hypothetical protein